MKNNGLIIIGIAVLVVMAVYVQQPKSLFPLVESVTVYDQYEKSWNVEFVNFSKQYDLGEPVFGKIYVRSSWASTLSNIEIGGRFCTALECKEIPKYMGSLQPGQVVTLQVSGMASSQGNGFVAIGVFNWATQKFIFSDAKAQYSFRVVVPATITTTTTTTVATTTIGLSTTTSVRSDIINEQQYAMIGALIAVIIITVAMFGFGKK